VYFHNLAGEDGILLINHMISNKPSWMGTEAFNEKWWTLSVGSPLWE